MWTSTIRSTRMSPSAIAEARSSFLRGSSMFMQKSSTGRRLRQAAIGAPGRAGEKAAIDGQIDTGYRAAHGREQPGDGLRDLGRFDHPAHRGVTLHQPL